MKVAQLDMFHNTLFLLPGDHREEEKKNIGQNEKVLKFFQDSPNQDFTPTEVFVLFGQQYPITSIRRAITDLTKAGDLEIVDGVRRQGLYPGRRGTNGVWRLKKK